MKPKNTGYTQFYKPKMATNKLVFFSLILLFFSSCDDGQVIVTTFDFDTETALTLCGESSTKVIYAINSDPAESISLNFIDPEFDGTSFNTIANPPEQTLLLSASNKLIYRTYNGDLQSNYFCSLVPPSSPQVLEEYQSTTGGSVIFNTTIVEQDDDDGVKKELEDRNGNGDFFDDDTDGDGLPDFIDADDDNDNVPTLTEIEGKNTLPKDYRDSDGDGAPNYLDDDDDGDGTISRYEDLNALDNTDGDNIPDLNPVDDDTDLDAIPNYLDPDNNASLTVDFYRQFVVSRTFRTLLIAKNVTMEHSTSDESITFETLIMGHLDIKASDTLSLDN